MVTRRIIRSVSQLAALVVVCVVIILFLDNRYDVLPSAIHDHLPSHHPGLVIIDVQVKTCSTISPFSNCRLDPNQWYRIEKDLYLGKGWLSAAYLHIRRKREEDLAPEDKVVLDIKVGRLNPAGDSKSNADWESRQGGIWLHRSARRHESDSKAAVTAVDILFGPDAAEPRTGWKLQDMPLLLDHPTKGLEAHLSSRHGQPQEHKKPTLRVRKDGKFKILQVSDLHLSTGVGTCRDPVPQNTNTECEADTRTLEFVGKILDDEHPDLVVLSGDQVNGETSPDVQTTIYKFADIFARRNIPYAAIFGNHDDEGHLTRSASMHLIESLPYSLSEFGPAQLSGVGNYFLEIYTHGTSHASAVTLYLLDTHGYSPDEHEFPGYAWIKDDQIRWFRETAKSLKIQHQKYPKIHMSMAFVHIPLPEYAKPDNERVGGWLEPPTAPKYNSGFFKALVDENILAVSCGHDHANDFCSLARSEDLLRKPDLWMCYAGGSGFGGYGGYGGYVRRVRVFEIDTNAARITTWKRLESGKTESKVDLQVIVDQGKVVGHN